MEKATFMETLRTTRAEWERLLDEIGEERMTQAGATGEWSVKDVIAHIMWSEREMIGVCQSHALVGSELWEMTADERNPIVVSWYRQSPLQAVFREEREVYAGLVAELEKLTDEDLNDARRFRAMPPDWLPWQIIAGCSFKHYRDHMPALRAWLDQQK